MSRRKTRAGESRLSEKEGEEYLAAAVEAAKLAGAIQLERFAKPHRVDLKGVANLVTEVDLECERAVIDTLQKRFPDHSFLAEEGGESGACSDYLWVIDPLDGTTNYAHGFPRFCVSIALAVQGVVEAGAVFAPVSGELFTAVRGKGAFVNGKPLRVSEVERVEDALICTGFAYDRGKRLGRDLEIYVKALAVAQSLRRTGCAALDLCDVAGGRFDGFWELNLNAWDVAAGALMIEEAGGRWSGLSGREVDIYAREILATNGKIHEEMVKVLTGPSPFNLKT